MKNTIDVIIGSPLRDKIKVAIGCVSAKKLVSQMEIPYRSTANADGYQRSPQPARINKLAKEILSKKVDLPTSVLLNLRGFKKTDLTENIKGGFQLNISSNKFYVVDGQHRLLALEKALNENPNIDYKINFVCLLGANENQELEQFYVVNSTAKSVKTDLALDLLRQRAESDSKVMDSVLEKGEIWKIKGQSVCQEINAIDGVWCSRIKMPNEAKLQTIIPSSGFVTSLKKLLTSPFFEALTEDDLVNILNSYWKGVARSCPDAFDNPKKYTIQKGIGVHVFHNILPDVVERLRSDGLDLKDPASYVDIISEVIEQLQGDNKDGAQVKGHEFWLTVPEGGAAGTYSSSAGKRLLLNKAKSYLPPIKI